MPTKKTTPHTPGPQYVEVAQGYRSCDSCGVGSDEARHGQMCLYFPPTSQIQSASKTMEALQNEAADAYAAGDTGVGAAKSEAAAAWSETIKVWRAYDEMRERCVTPLSTAAPDLLAALKAMLSAGPDFLKHYKVYSPSRLAEANAAIAKAEGREVSE